MTRYHIIPVYYTQTVKDWDILLNLLCCGRCADPQFPKPLTKRHIGNAGLSYRTMAFFKEKNWLPIIGILEVGASYW